MEISNKVSLAIILFIFMLMRLLFLAVLYVLVIYYSDNYESIVSRNLILSYGYLVFMLVFEVLTYKKPLYYSFINVGPKELTCRIIEQQSIITRLVGERKKMLSCNILEIKSITFKGKFFKTFSLVVKKDREMTYPDFPAYFISKKDIDLLQHCINKVKSGEKIVSQ